MTFRISQMLGFNVQRPNTPATEGNYWFVGGGLYSVSCESEQSFWPSDGTTFQIVVTVLDEQTLDPVEGVTVSLDEATATATIVPASTATDASGQATFTISSLVGGELEFIPTVDIAYAGCTVTFYASTVVASPGSSQPPLQSYEEITSVDWILRDGTSTSTITVTLRDDAGNPIQGLNVTLAVSGTFAPVTNVSISAPSGPSDVNGVVTFTVSADKDSFSGGVAWSYENASSGVTFLATVTETSQTIPMFAVVIFSRLVVTMNTGSNQTAYDYAVAQHSQASVENNTDAIWEIHIPAGVTCTNFSMGGPWAAGAKFLIRNEGNIYGLGGNGGGLSGNDGVAGSDGGPALTLDALTVDIVNTSGFIFGGGGGGGGGGSARFVGDPATHNGYSAGGGGGGGRGSAATTGGTATPYPGEAFACYARLPNGTDLQHTLGTIQQNDGFGNLWSCQLGILNSSGSNGSSAGAGSGGSHGTGIYSNNVPTYDNGSATIISGGGGAGGTWGAAGSAGPDASVSPGLDYGTPTLGVGGAGGAAGKAIDLGGGSVVNFDGNDSTHVKGAVS